MHEEAYKFVARHARGRHFGFVVEFGSLNINGSVRPLFDADIYHGIDVQPGPGVDELADAATWRAGGEVDCVVCCEVLEHTPDVETIVQSAYEALRPGGLLIITCATNPRAAHSAVDGGPLRDGEHYENIEPARLEYAVRSGFAVAELTIDRGRGDLYLAAESSPF